MGALLAAGLILLAAVPAVAADLDVIGLTLVVSGSVATLAAFNYDEWCPSEYTEHTARGRPTLCVRIESPVSDVREFAVTFDYRRPLLLWSGLAAVGAGTVLLLLPEPVRVVDVPVTPAGWRASRTFGW